MTASQEYQLEKIRELLESVLAQSGEALRVTGAPSPMPVTTEGAVVTSDLLLDISAGRVPGKRIMRGLGEREAIGTTASGEDIWRGNELTPLPTSSTRIPTPADAGEQMTVVSESTADNGATATGVLAVRIEYLNAAGAELSEDVTLNGTTPVNTVATDIRFVNNFYAIGVGSGTVAAGHIKIYKTGAPGLVYSMIALGGNMSLVPHRMVPAGKTLHLRRWSATEGNTKRAAIRLRATCDPAGEVLLPGVFLFKATAYLNKSTISGMPLAYRIPALAIVKVSAWATAINAEASCHWWGILEDD